MSNIKFLVVLLDGLGPEYMNLSFLKTLDPKPLETYYFTYPSVYVTLTGVKPKMEDFWRNGKLAKKVFSWRDFNVMWLWDKLECSQLYLNVPFTYPPKKINGVMVCYGLYGLHVYPKYYKSILKKMGYITDLDIDDPDFYSKCFEVVEKRTFAAFMGRNMDFIYIAYTAPDRVLHARLKIGESKVKKFMEYLDYSLELLFNTFKPKNYIVYSDHGFTKDGYHGPEHPESKTGLIASNQEINHIDEIHNNIIKNFGV